MNVNVNEWSVVNEIRAIKSCCRRLRDNRWGIECRCKWVKCCKWDCEWKDTINEVNKKFNEDVNEWSVNNKEC